MTRRGGADAAFIVMFAVMLVVATGNTALQSVLPALGRSLGVDDRAVAIAFSVSALLWVISAPFWANRTERHGHRAMVLLGMAGFVGAQLLCGIFLVAGINHLIGGAATFVGFIASRMLYGGLGSAAPPAVQAIVAGRTSRAQRTRALTLLASSFGLGTIVGPAISPYLVLGAIGPVRIGLAGPAFFAVVIGIAITLLVLRLPRERHPAGDAHGAMSAYPSIGGQQTGASVIAATGDRGETVHWGDARVRGWLIVGLIMGHAQAMVGQTLGFLVIDRLHLDPAAAIAPTGLVLMTGAGAALLVQWGLIPLLGPRPPAMIKYGLAIAAVGCAVLASATTLHGLAVSYGLAAIGFGFCRPGYTAGASLAVGAHAQSSVAGKVTSVNGASFVLGPSIGVALYTAWGPLPYLAATAALVLLFAYALVTPRLSDRALAASPEQ